MFRFHEIDFLAPRYRHMSADSWCVNGRQLPALFLVGAQKCSTTSLADQLFSSFGFAKASGLCVPASPAPESQCALRLTARMPMRAAPQFLGWRSVVQL